MRSGRALLLAVGVLCSTLLLAGCGSSGSAVGDVSRPDNHGYHGTYVDPPYTVPAVTLTDNRSHPFTLATDERPVDVVFFGYTNCPDVCQVVMGTITSAWLRLSKADRARVRVVFVTTDPSRDDERELTSYLARFDPSFTGVTGDIDRIDRLAKPLGVFIKKGQKLPSGGYEVSHSTTVYGVGHGEASVVWTGGTSAAAMADDLQRMLGKA
ncbi:MAG: SCO family protein [Marmoricola sp.]